MEISPQWWLHKNGEISKEWPKLTREIQVGGSVCFFAEFSSLLFVPRKGDVRTRRLCYFASSFRALKLNPKEVFVWPRVQGAAKVLFTSTLLFEKSFQD